MKIVNCTSIWRPYNQTIIITIFCLVTYLLCIHEDRPNGTKKMARTANEQQNIGLITYSTYYYSKAHGTSHIKQLNRRVARWEFVAG